MCPLSSRYLEAQSQLFAHYRVDIWTPGPDYSLNNPISDWIILRYLGNEGSGVCTVFKELNWYNCFAFMRVVRKGGVRRRRESGGGLPLGGEAPARHNDERGISGSAHSDGERAKGSAARRRGKQECPILEGALTKALNNRALIITNGS